MSTVDAAERKLIEDKIYKQGDMTLVFSDGVVFKVDRIFVLANSTVLRDAHAAATKDADILIELDDAHIETAATVRFALDHWMAGDDRVPLFKAQETRYMDVIRLRLVFADKWGCRQLAAHIFEAVMPLMLHHNYYHVMPIYALASKYGREDLCRYALATHTKQYGSDGLAAEQWVRGVRKDIRPQHAKALVAVLARFHAGHDCAEHGGGWNEEEEVAELLPSFSDGEWEEVWGREVAEWGGSVQ